MKVFIAASAFLMLWLADTHAQTSCRFCHTDTAYAAVYDSSRHGKENIECGDCHVRKQNIFSFFGERYVNLLSFSFENAHPARPALSENCNSCHRAVRLMNMAAEGALPEQLKTIGLVFEHEKHDALRDSCMSCHRQGRYEDNKVLARVSQDDPMGCASCHLNVVHETPAKYGRPIPKEKDCALCHNKDNKCPSMKNISDIKDDKRCTECHPNQYTF